jgi:hypothetical protein
MARVVKVCATCGSSNVYADSACSWSVEDQRWEIGTVYDSGFSCADCDDECDIVDREVEG